MDKNPVVCPLAKPQLLQYSPYKGRMHLLDRLDDYCLAPASLSAAVEINTDSLFFDVGKNLVPPWISFEYMAQGIALLAGLKRAGAGEKPNIGFIMNIRDFHVNCAGFPAERTVTIRVRQVLLHDDIAVFEGETWMDGARATFGTLMTIEGSPALIERMKENESEGR